MEKNKIFLITSLFLLFALMPLCYAISTVTIDANNYYSHSGYASSKWRSEAMGDKDVLMQTGSKLYYDVNLEPQTVYGVKVKYSNDGPSENIRLAITASKGFGGFFANFDTMSTGGGGYGWNIFADSRIMYFKTGHNKKYTFSLETINTDLVEMDRVTFTPKI